MASPDSVGTRPLSSARRFYQMYVEIPPSPYRSPSKASRDATDKFKSQASPLRIHNDSAHSISSSTPSSLIKRKRSTYDMDDILDLKVTREEVSMKKQKKSPGAKAEGLANQDITDQTNGDEQYPNGYFYCHQCTRKRDMSGTWS